VDALQKRLQSSQLQLLGSDVFFSPLMVRHCRLNDVHSRLSAVCEHVQQAFAQNDEGKKNQPELNIGGKQSSVPTNLQSAGYVDPRQRPTRDVEELPPVQLGAFAMFSQNREDHGVQFGDRFCHNL
jgi:hypothetical protein